MKKLLLSFILLIFPFSSFASFLSENSKYSVVGNTATYKQYIDFDAVRVKRYDPPYYILCNTVYTENFKRGVIIAQDYEFYCNYEEQKAVAYPTTFRFYNSDGTYDNRYETGDARDIENMKIIITDGKHFYGFILDFSFLHAYSQFFFK